MCRHLHTCVHNALQVPCLMCLSWMLEMQLMGLKLRCVTYHKH